MVVIFHFHSNSNRTFCEQTVETLIRPCSVVSDLGFYLFAYVPQTDPRLMCVKKPAIIIVANFMLM